MSAPYDVALSALTMQAAHALWAASPLEPHGAHVVIVAFGARQLS